MRKTLLSVLVFACISQCLCAVTWNSPSNGDTETLAENSTVGLVIVTLNATALNTISYVIVSQTPPEDKFGIDNTNELYVKAKLDYETTTSYDVQIRALDNSASEQADITLTIAVTDVNDKSPVITSGTSADIPTNTAIGLVVFTVTSTDEDTVGTVTYSITSGNDNQDFSINATTGEITLNNALDINATPEYDIGIEATDGVNSATKTITFYVNDVIWQTPQDGQTDTLAESTTIDTTIIELQANNSIIYSFTLEPADEESKFKIESDGIKLKESLDYETTKLYTFTLKASKSSSLTAVITYTVNITDVNDEPPEFTSATTMDLTKDTDINTSVYTAEVTDPDTVGSSTFSIAGGNTNADFSINTTTGDLTLENALDPDSTSTYSLVIEATDSVFTATMTLSVTVNRIVWTEPVKGTSEELPEDTAVSTVIKNLTAETATSYIIRDQIPYPDQFGIINTNELVLVSELDYENTTSHIISLRAIDGSGKSADITYIVNVTDVNDLEPVFKSNTFEVIPENTPVGTTIHTASATDGDTVGTVSYSITAGNDGETFGIDNSTGDINLNKALNPNITADLSYNLIIQATDSVHPVTQSLAVTVKSVPALVLPADGTTNITENVDTSGPLVVLTLDSTDLDNDPSPTYSIDTQSHPGTFSISSDNTELITTASFDREQISEYNVTIRVTDSSEFDLSSAATLTVTIEDQNDVAPTFTSNATLDLADDTPATGEVILHSVTTDDPDITGAVTYTITAGNINDDFTMNPNGSITLNNALNASITPTYTLTVVANDTVNVTPFNLTVNVVSEPQLDIPASGVAIAEGNYTSSMVWTLSSTDEDGDTNPTYAILEQSVNGTFEINGDNTQLITSATFDFEELTSYTVTLQVTDSSSLQRSSTGILTVKITDVNDEPPAFNPASVDLELREDAPIGLVDYIAASVDPDSVSADYSIIGGNTNDVFSIDAVSGNLSLAKLLNSFDDLSYLLIVQANDSVNVGTQSVNVTVVTAPVFKFPENVEIAENTNTSGGYEVLALNSTDRDGDQNPQYEIVSQSDPGTFELNADNTTLVTTAEFDYEVSTGYNVTLRVTDTSTFTMSSTATLVISVTDMNDNAPVFQSNDTFEISEFTSTGTVVYVAKTTDVDTGSIVTYSFTDGNTDNTFSINETSGEITLATDLQPNVTLTYSLVLQANDSAQTKDYTVTVYIKTAPIFVLPSTNITISEDEDTSMTYTVWTLNSTDADGDTGVVYEIVSQSVNGTFDINADNTELTTNASFDFETTQMYTVTLRATDNSTFMLSSTATLTVYITDANDSPPEFTSNGTLDLPEFQDSDTVVYIAETTDNDTVGTVSYSFTGGNSDGVFSIDSASGNVTIIKALDPDTSLNYMLTIQANDRVNSVTLNLTVNVITVPTITAFQINITENSVTEEYQVWNLTSTDKDGDSNPVYVLVNQSDPGVFEINDAKTAVVTNASFDYETTTQYTFTVEVTDSSSLQLSSTAVFNVSVIDENDVAPNFTTSAEVDVLEVAVINTTVYTAVTEDPDTIGSVTYTIIGGDEDGAFIIDGVSGNVTLEKSLNASKKLTHVLHLQANDTVNVAKFNVTLNVRTAPFMNIPDTVTVEENVAIGSDFLILNSTDLDGDNNPVYELVSESVPGTFKINNDNTKLVTNASIDYESVQNFTVTVRVTEISDLNLTSTAEFTVYVLDGNDISPVFTSANSTEVAENKAVDESFYTAAAEDEDTMGNISFSIIDVSPSNVFHIDPNNGSLSLQSALSPTTVDDLTYNLVIQANDSVNAATLNLTVHVKTVPVIHVIDIYLPEDVNTTETYIVWPINSTDLDGDENATFGIVSQSNMYTFEVSDNAIVTSATFDFETTKNYTIVINTTDTSTFKLSSSATLTVYITDVNDNNPTFTSNTSLVVLETANTGDVLYNATTEDEDTVGNVTYTLSDGNRNSDFAIGPTSGALTLQNKLDPQNETELVYDLVIEANDSINTAYLNLTVNVKTAPKLDITDVSIIENTNTSGPYELWNITWSDLDGDLNPTVEIAVESVPGTFQIINDSVLVTSAEFDYENTTQYTVTMKITDVHGLTSNDTLTLYVLDENDVTPVFVSDSTLDISEKTATGTAVYTANVTDPDTNPTIEYLITDGNTDGFFSINPTDGTVTLEKEFNSTTSLEFNLTLQANDTVNVGELILTVSVITVPVINAFQINITENNEPGVVWNLTSSDRDGDVDPVYFVVNQSDAGIFDINDANTSVITNTSFDFESQTMYTFEVEVTDKSSLKLSSTATFTVSVVDENDVTPEFTSNAVVQLQEDTPLNTVVYIANTTDEDTVGSTSYSIIDGNDNIFEIDAVSGNITLITKLNASATLTHVLTLQANDTVNVATFNVTFTLSTAPVMVIPDQVTVVEGGAIGSDVLTLNSTDLDGDTDPVYEIVNQSVAETFKINENNTKLVTNVSIDYESVKNFTVTVRVTDTSAFEKSSTSEFTVSVVDANDETPVFTSANSTDIPETTNIETVIYTATTEDIDTTGTVSYAIIDGDPNSVFDINAHNGSVTLESALSPTTVENVTYNLVIQANDSVNTATLNFTVNVKTAPVVHVVDINLREDVNTTGTYTVWAINSTDADGDEDTTFTIVSQSDPGTFEISTDNAIVTNASFDFEVTKNYTIVINATDSSVFHLSSTVTLTVFITDVNDVTPTFTSDTSLVVLQTTEIGTILYNATTEDIDTVGNVTYTITDGNRGNDFSIEPETGGLTLQNNLEPQVESDVVYFLVIEANDTQNTAYLNLTVDIKTVPYLIVTDMNVTENTDTSGPFHVWTIEWIDLDGDENHTFAIVNESAPGTFEITNEVLVTNVTLDYETVKNYTATISITDVHGLSSADTITLSVLDQNDVPPVFTSNDTLDLSEETETGVVVYTVSTTDPDTVGSIEYSSLDVSFNLNASTGDLTLPLALDFETTPFFTFKITANDSVNVATFNLTVNVKTRPDINFTGVNVEISENEDTSDFFVLLNLTSTDRDGDPNPQYDIISESVPGTFLINGDKLQTNASFDYEQLQSYSVNIRVTDSSLGLTSNDTLTVTVTDVNDNAPSILSPATLELREDTPTGTLVFRVTAMDLDTVGNLSFSINDGNTDNDFGIDAESGNVTLDNALNASAQISYSLVIVASDGTLNDTKNLDVTVKTAPVLVFPDSNVTLAEGTYAGVNFSVLTLSSADLDNDPNPRYELVSQSVPGTFFLSEDNTRLLTSADFNYTALNMYEVTLRVTDSSDFNMTSTRNLTVYITDTNNLPPEFTSPTTVVIPENQVTGSIVYTAAAVDTDIGGEISYTILSGNTNNDFDLDPESGNLTLANTLRPSDNLQYVLKIQANDTVNTAILELTVDVKSIPVIAGDNLTIVETTDTAGTYVVLELTSTDLDNDTDPKYTIITQNVNGTFEITNGTLLTTTATFDHETRNSYEIVVQVTDTSDFALSSSATYTVVILDANDAAPVFTSGTEIYVSEEEKPGEVVYTAVTYDNDTSGSIMYSIIGGNTNADFNIDLTTGVVTLSKELRPQDTLEYTLQLQANDSTNQGYLNLTVIVVTAPQIVFLEEPVTMVENTNTSGGNVVWICASQDVDGNTDPVYSIVSQSVNDTFKLNNDKTEVVTTAEFDFEETQSYEIVISVTDTSPLELSSTATLTVHIQDLNDVTPNFTSPGSIKILKNTDPGTVVYTTETEDPDTLGNVTYKITGGNTNNDFSIDTTSGNITVINVLNVPTTANYSLVIQANDTVNVASFTLFVELIPDVDECLSNPCQNDATCVDGIDKFTCDCAPGYDGTTCENDIDECESDPCFNGATCEHDIDEYNCTCADGFSGVNCEIDVNECESSPCQNGTCLDLVNGYNCTCVPGYEGVNCEIDIDECESNQCQNNGTCVDGINGYRCTCTGGYDGDNCENDIDECESDPCFNGATCEHGIDEYNCTCTDGFSGVNCEIDVNECESSPCQNGTCLDLVNGYNCTCVPGYEGVNCEIDDDECESSPCQNGTCLDLVNGYNCTCVPGYEGVNCEIDIDECESDPCFNGATCEHGIDEYNCTCADGFSGVQCETDADECGSSPCQNGTCLDLVNGYNCTCVPGYEGVNCEIDIDGCASVVCTNNGTCFDLVNDFNCTCQPGYTGEYCEQATCLSTLCQNAGTCAIVNNQHECTCATGYDGIYCEVVTCETNPCQNAGTCAIQSNQHECTCAAGYDGTYCETATCYSYPCQNGAVCSIVNNQHVCNCFAGNEGTYCRTGLHLGYGAAEGDTSMYGTDDACSPVLRVSYDLPFMQRRFTKIYVCTNGLLCFNRPFYGYSIPKKQGFNYDFLNIYCLAPYFADLYLTFTGRVWYQAYNTLTDDSSESTDVSIKVHNLVNELYDEEFNPVYVLKATWYEARYIGGRPSETATFQVIYATDGQRSYAFYNYAEMNFQSGLQFIGIISNGNLEGLDYSSDGSYLLRPDKNLIFGAYKGAGSYKLTTEETALVPNYGVQCLAWRKTEKQNIDRYIEAANRMPLCPCVSFFLFFDRQFGFPTFDGSRFTVPLLPGRAYAPHGKTCAYSRWTGGFIWFGRRAGSFHSFNEYIYPNAHALFDEKYKRICCDYSNNCNFYYEVRPRTQGCYFRSLFRFGGGFGDPHISTLDGVTYTFNGYGEYILLRITSADFEIQSRTERAKKSDGSDSEATIFTAFVIQSSDVWLQVELNNEKTGINLFVGTNKTDWADYTGEFQSKGDNFTYVTDALSLSRDNNTLVTSFSGTGVAFNVTYNVGLLQMSTGLLNTYNNKTSGLLGNFNGDVTDDYFPRAASSALPSNSTERMIFKDFGQTWITSANESNFKYDNGKSHADYNFPDFVPKFLDEANQTIVDEAKSVCGEGNNQCIFDMVFTGNKELAQTTTLTEAEAAEISAEASNEVPELSVSSGTTLQEGENYIYVTVNESATFTVNGTDDGTLTYEFVNNSAGADLGTQNNDGTVDVSFVVTSTDPVYLSMTAKDDKGINSPPVDIVIVLCTNCNSHGVCNNSVIRDDVNSTDNFKYAMCECEPYWEGADCELDFDGCDASPCSVGRNCTDRQADEHKANPSLKPYTCTACPTGFKDVDGKCEDDNECNNTSVCSQICINTVGSFSCQCNTGYRLAQDGATCDDINECEESTSGCIHVCTNTAGSYNCSCYDGFIYNTTSKSCDKDQTGSVGCDALDCDSAAGCTLNETNLPVCFCDSGYQIQANNTCTDIDECTSAVCSQTCSNTVGSYSCGCFTGYSLLDDRVSCEPCPFPKYGENCGMTCQCGRGSLRCDPVRGCVCKAGWTGTHCDTDVNECLVPNTCKDVNKVCTNTIGSHTCSCRSGYSLSNNSCVDIDECNDPALNTCEQVCTNTVGGFSCSCNSGYNIDSNDTTICTDYDECSAGVSGCEHICTNKPGRYNCECYFGFLLNSDRKTCTKVSDPCTLFPDVKCSDICLVVNEKPQCSCNTGFILGTDQQTCIDVNECDSDLNLCSETDTCVNEAGGYTCSCNAGYKLENDLRTCKECDPFHYGLNCASECNCGAGATRCDHVTGCVCDVGWTGEKCDTDKDECANSPCMGQNKICTNTPGSYTCTCDTGYKEKNGTCQDVDECSSTSLNDCSQICTNSPGSYQCSCNHGFMQDENTCTDIDECEGQNECSQVCSNTLGSYRCSCKQGFKLDTTHRKTCIPAEQCDPNPCKTNTQCTVVNDVPTCFCEAGYEFESGSNTTCEDIAECSRTPSPCSQGCIDFPGGYECACNITGYRLDTDKSTCIACSENTYGGNCTQNCSCEVSNTLSCNAANGSCTCKEGWTGDTCEDNINECDDAAIHNCPVNSLCMDKNGSFYCKCDTGYLKSGDGSCQTCDQGQYGVDCTNTCSCNTSNTETCNPVNGSCTCKSGWDGDYCGQNKNECTLNTFTCPQNATCEDTQGSYKCNCDTGFSKTSDEKCKVCGPRYYGQDCATPCSCYAVNTKVCDHVTGNCTCNEGWEGEQCSKDIDECTTSSNPCTERLRTVCINNNGSYTCQCDEGFELDDAETCVDINECEKGSDDCLQNCNNTEGSYTCFCDVGYNGTGNDCTECTGNSYGEDCRNTCDCEQNHTTSTTQQCENVNGTCLCLSTWTGERCEIDVDECTLGTDNCNKSNEGCHNTEGGFLCSCIIGFKRDANGTCIFETSSAPTPTTEPDGFEIVKVVLILEITLDSGVDLTITTTYNTYKTEVYNRLLNIYQSNLPEGTNLTIIIRNIRSGSLIVEYDVKVPTSELPDVAFTSAKIASSQETLQIFDENTTAIGLSINNVNVTAGGNYTDVLLCEMYEASAGTCGTQCVVIDGKPVCQLKTEIETSSAPIPTTEPDGFEIVKVVLILEMTLDSGVDLTITTTYNTYKTEVYNRLFNIYQSNLPEGTNLTIIIRDIRSGSLIVEYDVKVPTQALPDVAFNNAKIASSQETLQIFDENATVIGLSINNVNVTVGGNYTDVLLCELYEASAGTCGTQCVVILGKPACQLKTEIETSSAPTPTTEPETSSAPTPTTEPDGFEIVKVVLVLEITLDSGVDLSITTSYNTYKTEVYNRLFNIYKSNLPEGTNLTIIIRDIRSGSLILEYDVIVPTSALSDVTFTNAKIASSQEILQIFDENATVIGLSINNVNVTVGGNYTDVLLCELYEASAGTCGTQCVVIDGKPACQLKTEIDNLPLILGLSIGIPMFFMCVALLVLCIVYYHQRKQADSSESDRSYGERDSIIFDSKMPTRINTRIPVGPFTRHQDRMEYPDYTEYSRDSRRHVYGNSRSYDNDNDPERNKGFSWDYLLRELDPGEPYKIKRPKVDTDTQRYDEY